MSISLENSTKAILEIHIIAEDSQGYGTVIVERVKCSTIWDAEERLKELTQNFNCGCNSIAAKGILIPSERFVYAVVHSIDS